LLRREKFELKKKEVNYYIFVVVFCPPSPPTLLDTYLFEYTILRSPQDDAEVDETPN